MSKRKWHIRVLIYDLCTNCGKELFLMPSVYAKNKLHYCCRACYYELRRSNLGLEIRRYDDGLEERRRD